MAYLKNNRIATLLILVLLMTGALFLFPHKKPEPQTLYEKAATSFLSEQTAQQLILDSDGDGLRDWEEILWKSNPNEADTDKDGYPDREETTLGYDPTDSYSNPQTGKKRQKETIFSSVKKPTEPINLTQNFAKAMGSKVINPAQLSQTDLSNPFSLLDEQTGNGLLYFISELRPELNGEEIKTHNDNSYAALMKYIADMEKAVPENPYPDKAEDDILAEAIETGNFRKIDEYINYFETSISSLKKIVAPSNLFEMHKREIELVMATQKVYESVKEVNTDPIKTVLALQENQKFREEMAGILTSFWKLIESYAE